MLSCLCGMLMGLCRVSRRLFHVLRCLHKQSTAKGLAWAGASIFGKRAGVCVGSRGCSGEAAFERGEVSTLCPLCHV